MMDAWGPNLAAYRSSRSPVPPGIDPGTRVKSHKTMRILECQTPESTGPSHRSDRVESQRTIDRFPPPQRLVRSSRDAHSSRSGSGSTLWNDRVDSAGKPIRQETDPQETHPRLALPRTIGGECARAEPAGATGSAHGHRPSARARFVVHGGRRREQRRRESRTSFRASLAGLIGRCPDFPRRALAGRSSSASPCSDQIGHKIRRRGVRVTIDRPMARDHGPMAADPIARRAWPGRVACATA